jgi:60 kDa SS-A/Ro ribonucleoprotein
MAVKTYKGVLSTHTTPQTQAISGREAEMVKNNAGGYTFKLDSLGALQRFLILGTEGGTYYANERDHTLQASKNLKDAIENHGVEAVNMIVEISESGRAPKNDPALFALAMAAGIGNDETRALALASLPRVARTGTHLFQFMNFVEDFRGWGRGLRKAVARWYEQDINRVALQAVKYRQREGYTHRDALRLSHPKAVTPGHQALFAWITQGNTESLPRIVEGYLKAQDATTAAQAVNLITEYGLPREALPTNLLNEKAVWEALLENMPITAMIRNLGNMSKVGLLTPLSDASKKVRSTLVDTEVLRKGRVHPFQVLTAALTYGSGEGLRGSGTWDVDNKIVDALEDSFYLAFGNIEPSGKNVMLGIDVSGSMGGGNYNPFRGGHSIYAWGGGVMGIPTLTPAVVAALMAMVTAKAEPEHFIGGFATSFVNLGITSKDRIETVMKKTSNKTFGGTDAAVSMRYARQKGIPVDLFAIYTDNETWAGERHASQELVKYRKSTGIPAKMVTVGVTATNFTIADPKDPGQMDVVGFDSAAPGLISDFAADRL